MEGITRRLLPAAGGSDAPAVPSAGEPTGARGWRGSPIIRGSFSEDLGKAERRRVAQDPPTGDTLQT